MGETYEILKDMGRKTLKGGLAIPEYIFAAPSFYRKYLSRPDAFLIVPHSLLIALEICEAIDPIKNLLGDYSYLPLATHVTGNVASGLYEWFRYEKRKISSPTTSSSPSSASSSNLEKQVEKEDKPTPKDIPNPWDIDIPKIENIFGGMNYE